MDQQNSKTASLDLHYTVSWTLDGGFSALLWYVHQVNQGSGVRHAIWKAVAGLRNIPLVVLVIWLKNKNNKSEKTKQKWRFVDLHSGQFEDESSQLFYDSNENTGKEKTEKYENQFFTLRNTIAFSLPKENLPH